MASNPEITALSVEGLSKTFSGSRALKDVSINFRRGAITALLGPNGCGKSTLIKILAGFHSPDDGPRVEIGGEPISTPVDPKEAYARGLRFVHQDLGLVEEMSVADNLAFAHAFDGKRSLGKLSRRQLKTNTRKELERFGLDIDPSVKTGTLSRTDQIMVAITRAFQGISGEEKSGVVILDEPTASLPAHEVDRVLVAVDKIREAGGTVIYVTHRIDEVIRIADDLVVLRDGEVAAQRERGDLDETGIANLIVGAVAKRPPDEHVEPTDEDVLVARGLNGYRLRDVSFNLRKGEILGIAGLAGCGRSELARIISGDESPSSGEIEVEGEARDFSAPKDAIKAGIAYVPPDRARLGCIPEMSVRHNISLSSLDSIWSKGRLHQRKERSSVGELLKTYDVRPADTERRMAYLSGGNQQKAVIAKFARLEPKIMVVDEPTQGVDISGKQEIATVLRSLAANGCGLILASSDFDEVAGLCDRVLVLDRGAMVGIFNRGEIHEEQLAVLTANQQKGVVA